MIINLRKTRDHVARRRRAAYLAAWPLSRQMEAHADAANGRPETLAAMLADLAAIKAAHPYPPESEGT
ncbi:hypothetical protein [Niveispirillum sp.]|uniref:hypothetical protein n=1 Tax=Niveispirillum sp. TaxID=1917217 RepID=UPI001B6DCCAC|nr:hypothetical protein [Niveispirillum sp.]MBP7339644.1 hypothetical protein [Niveispirillum sp.]